tara:strand:- start:15291 stop:16232 length:942 start_codon:yes stop_codon:yes gene_type:complete
MDKDFYNKSSADSLGWDPSWFGCNEFDLHLVKAVQKWQRENGLTGDGLVGPMTYRRVWTEREANISEHMPRKNIYASGAKHIVHNGHFIPIEWDKVILWDDSNGFKANKGCYTDYSGKPDRAPTMFVNHWDVCLSAESCAKVLNRRKISVHFLIDNDGTIFQMLDTQHKAWHAGIARYEGGNSKGIGVEISNAYSLKYQDWYASRGFGERPVQEHAYVHGRKLDPFLDFYPIQLEALKALWKAVHIGIGIPLEYPANSQGHIETSVHRDCERGKFKGICNHYNFTKNKKDCAGLDLPALIEEVKNSKMYCIDK